MPTDLNRTSHVRLITKIRNEIPEIPLLAAKFQEFARQHDISEDVVFSFDLALDELLTNTIEYGYSNDQTGYIHLEFVLDDDSLTIEIEDDALAYNPLEAPLPDLDAPVIERPVGGLGVYLVRKIMDSVDYELSDGRNCLKISRHL